jgi:hypothetical protein
MSIFSEDLINKIMLYVSHPCADMINNLKITRFDNVKIIRTTNKQLPNTKFRASGIFCIMDDTSVKFEQQCESNVVEINIYNKFQIRRITDSKFKQFKQINYGIFL